LAGFLTILLFYGDGVVSPMPQPPTWRKKIMEDKINKGKNGTGT
jgi:hypothetical protein